MFTKEQIVDAIAGMSAMEIAELVSMMEQKFGVSSSPGDVVGRIDAEVSVEPAEEKTEFDVVLGAVGENKIAVIKAVRGVTNLGLREAKELVESAPVVVKSGISRDEAEAMEKLLEAAGASAALR